VGQTNQTTDQPTRLKVIGFDSWTGGARIFEHLVDALNERGVDLSIIHLGSWGSDMGRPKTEKIGKLDFRDISSFPTQSFPAVLKSEQPAAVLFLSTDTFAHRAFNRYCRWSGIPTMYLFHGLRSVQATDSGSIYKISLMAQSRFIAERLVKSLTLVWPTYAKALWQTGGTYSEWIRFAKDIIVLGLGRYARVSASDARTDSCCVFIEADVNLTAHKYGFDKEDIVVVGNSDLASFGLGAEAIGAQLKSPTIDYQDVMYVDSAFIYSGWVFSSKAEYVEHLRATRRALESQGKHLVFKPHPDHFRTEIISELKAEGFDICMKEEFVTRLQRCCGCIVEQSSAAVIPALQGVPLLLASYGKLKGQRFGQMLLDYPRARMLHDVNEVSAVIAEEQQAFNYEDTRKWIDQNCGPMPAEDMPIRVADALVGLCNKNQSGYKGTTSKQANAYLHNHPLVQSGTIS
jgi:hypothetical protein